MYPRMVRMYPRMYSRMYLRMYPRMAKMYPMIARKLIDFFFFLGKNNARFGRRLRNKCVK